MAIDISLQPVGVAEGDGRVHCSSPCNNQRLLVNAAFLQEIKDCNPDLWHAMHSLRQTCESDASPSQLVRDLVRQLNDLRDRWAMQFALEDSYGYMRVPMSPPYPGSVESYPQWKSDRAETVLAQHCTLYLMLSDLAEQAEELQYRGVTSDQLQRLISRTREFDAAIRDHEAREQELIER